MIRGLLSRIGGAASRVGAAARGSARLLHSGQAVRSTFSSLTAKLVIGTAGVAVAGYTWVVTRDRAQTISNAEMDTVTKLEKVFRKYATVNLDNVWYLSRDDFIKLVLSADVSAKVHPGDSELDILFRVADQNKDNLVSLADFTLFYLFLTSPEAEFEILFKMFDTDANGVITKGTVTFMRYKFG